MSSAFGAQRIDDQNAESGYCSGMNRRYNRPSGRGPLNWLRRQLRRSPRPLWTVFVAHVLALGISLVLYALPHHVIPHGEASIGIVSTRGGGVSQQASATPEPAATPEAEAANEAVPEATAEPTPEPTPEVEVGDFRPTLGEHFTDGEVTYSSTSYQSGNVSVSLYTEFNEDAKAQVYFADIYIADISCLTTVFGQDTYGRGYTEWVEKVAERYQSVIALNGDYYGTRDSGVVIRNGTLYRDNKTTNDIAILYWDGHMEMFHPDDFDAVREMDRGAYQSWCFGPSLLDGTGTPIGVFNSSYGVIKKNPRSAIGYYEPGHYCFVTVDGRNNVSHGANMDQLARIMSGFGCKLAYNLDGGQTSLLCYGTQLINDPSDGGRSSSDYILIVDRVTP